jgi:hypothetical protein
MNATGLFLGYSTDWKDVQVHLSALQGLWGGWQVFVSGGGVTVIRRVSPVKREQRYKLTLTGAEVQSLLETCVENDLLAVPLPLRPGRPDETMIEITLVNKRGENRTVKKWAGEPLAAFDAPSRLLFALTTRAHDMIPFYTGPFEWNVSSDQPANPSEGVAI